VAGISQNPPDASTVPVGPGRLPHDLRPIRLLTRWVGELGHVVEHAVEQRCRVGLQDMQAVEIQQPPPQPERAVIDRRRHGRLRRLRGIPGGTTSRGPSCAVMMPMVEGLAVAEGPLELGVGDVGQLLPARGLRFADAEGGERV